MAKDVFRIRTPKMNGVLVTTLPDGSKVTTEMRPRERSDTQAGRHRETVRAILRAMQLAERIG